MLVLDTALMVGTIIGAVSLVLAHPDEPAPEAAELLSYLFVSLRLALRGANVSLDSMLISLDSRTH